MIFIDNPEEELSLYRQAADKQRHVGILAERCGCEKKEVVDWLADHGAEVDKRWGAGGVRRSRKKEEGQKMSNEGMITLTTAEAAIIRDYLTKCRNAHEDGNAGQAFTAGDRLATVLDVILTLAAARAEA